MDLMRQRAVLPLLVVFLFVALFGMYAMLSHDAHERGCPLMMAEAVVCDATFVKHISVWQSLFASILLSFFTLFAIVIAFVSRVDTVHVHEYALFRSRGRVPSRPTLLQELLSQGILHSRAY